MKSKKYRWINFLLILVVAAVSASSYTMYIDQLQKQLANTPLTTESIRYITMGSLAAGAVVSVIISYWICRLLFKLCDVVIDHSYLLTCVIVSLIVTLATARFLLPNQAWAGTMETTIVTTIIHLIVLIGMAALDIRKHQENKGSSKVILLYVAMVVFSIFSTYLNTNI